MRKPTQATDDNKNIAFFIIGISIGAAVLSAVLYLLLKKRAHEILIPVKGYGGQTYTFIPPRAIPLSGAARDEKTEIQDLFQLEIKARPSVFKRGETGTIVVTTLPGTLCTLAARYSTGASPSSLHGTSVRVGGAGQHRWLWDIGTSGTFVDVSVIAEREDGSTLNKTLRVDITD